MKQPTTSLPLKILYAMVAAMLLWAIIGSVMAAELADQTVVIAGVTDVDSSLVVNPDTQRPLP